MHISNAILHCNYTLGFCIALLHCNSALHISMLTLNEILSALLHCDFVFHFCIVILNLNFKMPILRCNFALQFWIALLHCNFTLQFCIMFFHYDSALYSCTLWAFDGPLNASEFKSVNLNAFLSPKKGNRLQKRIAKSDM